ncbi:protein singed wings 2 isoform X2 [Daktulosphaira vitifoliae]|uniref:protein singed wings 2 isoform X2 n=1 Tax=Daktulosphaira vitifoliae TaxID=58002 RepID=UPI0021A985E4|nr:protein singed wings 2 isoform X2 [Daktulosphaira vitifoliae]
MDGYQMIFKYLLVLLIQNDANSIKLSEFCAPNIPQNKCISIYRPDGLRIGCSGGFHGDFLDEEYFSAHTLMFCHWPFDYFEPATSLYIYSKLAKFTIINSEIKTIIGVFPENMQSLKTLNLSHLNLERIESSAFMHLSSLEILDLSYNKLNQFSFSIIEDMTKLKQIWLAGQSWFCKNDMTWLLQSSKEPFIFKVMDADKMICGGYKYIGKPMIPVLRLLYEMEKECPYQPDNCICTLDNVVRGRGNYFYLHPLITVDCSYRGLKMLPKKLPHNTTTLLMQGNQVTSLEELLNNRYYAKLLDLHMDNNLLSSISILEGSHWLAQCRVLSLKGNNLSKVPTYALDNAFQRNRNIVQLYLGDNPWRCDCLFAPSFQDLLIKYQSLIIDQYDIKCSDQEDDEYYLTPIHDLPRNSLCKTSTSSHKIFFDVLNLTLASLIVILFLKFSYDYILYKKCGRLPWVATKLP